MLCFPLVQSNVMNVDLCLCLMRCYATEAVFGELGKLQLQL